MNAQHTPTNTAQSVISKAGDGQLQNDMLNFFGKRYERVSYDLDQYWFNDGSSCLVQTDENLRPVAIIEVQQ